MNNLTKVLDSAQVARNSYQGTPSFERPAGQGDLMTTLARYSEAAGNVVSIFSGSQGDIGRTEPTSEPKPPGSAVVSGAPKLFGFLPAGYGVPLLAAIALAAAFFFFKRK